MILYYISKTVPKIEVSTSVKYFFIYFSSIIDTKIGYLKLGGGGGVGRVV